jgi:hypothetical protein
VLETTEAVLGDKITLIISASKVGGIRHTFSEQESQIMVERSRANDWIICGTYAKSILHLYTPDGQEIKIKPNRLFSGQFRCGLTKKGARETVEINGEKHFVHTAPVVNLYIKLVTE